MEDGSAAMIKHEAKSNGGLAPEQGTGGRRWCRIYQFLSFKLDPRGIFLHISITALIASALKNYYTVYRAF
jgi:hypothetical protein